MSDIYANAKGYEILAYAKINNANGQVIMDISNREGADAVDSFRFSIKFNLNLEHHREAFERLSKIKKGDKSEFCINCILGKEDENIEIKNLIETTIKICLEGVHFSNTPIKKSQNNDKNEIDIMDGVLDFMTSFD